MSYSHSKLDNRLRAKSLLDRLKDKLVDVSGTTIEIGSKTAEASMEWWRLSKVGGVHVYPTSEGWHCDLVFKDLPVGVPTIVGSAQPYPSKADALEHAVQQLSLMAVNDKLPLPEARNGFRYFKFDNVEIPVRADMVAKMSKQVEPGYTEFRARSRLAYLRNFIAKDRPMSASIINGLDQELHARVTIACGVAMTFGIGRFTIQDGVWKDFENGPKPDADAEPAPDSDTETTPRM